MQVLSQREEKKKKKRKKRREREDSSSESSEEETDVGAPYAIAEVEMFSAVIQSVETPLEASSATTEQHKKNAEIMYTIPIQEENTNWREVHEAYGSDDEDYGVNSIKYVQVDIKSKRARLGYTC